MKHEATSVMRVDVRSASWVGEFSRSERLLGDEHGYHSRVSIEGTLVMLREAGIEYSDGDEIAIEFSTFEPSDEAKSINPNAIGEFLVDPFSDMQNEVVVDARGDFKGEVLEAVNAFLAGSSDLKCFLYYNADFRGEELPPMAAVSKCSLVLSANATASRKAAQ